MRSALCLSLVLAGCGLGRAAPSVPGLVTFEGTCDASGAVPLDARRFAVADDENNVLRIYDAERGGPPLAETDLTPGLRGAGEKKKKAKKEADLEAATRLGDLALWISSHARSKKGKEKPERSRFFATTLPGANGGAIALEGAPYYALARDLAADPRLQALGIPAALERAPQDPGGFNLEGMTSTPDDAAVLLGFRNPVPQGRALIVPLENPRALLAGERARFGEPVLLALGGLGVRSLSSWRGQYLIAAGAFGEGGERSKLFRWKGLGAAAEALKTELHDLNPEGFFTPEARDSIMVLSDDGARAIDGERCKDLEDASKKRFRGLWIAMR
jgi:hypothetical protein